MKKAILTKVMLRMRLFEKGIESNEFELLVANKYGSSKHSYSIDNINDEMVLYAESFFPVEYGKNAKLLISVIFRLSLIPYIE